MKKALILLTILLLIFKVNGQESDDSEEDPDYKMPKTLGPKLVEHKSYSFEINDNTTVLDCK